MSLFLLDTDTLSLAQDGNKAVLEAIEARQKLGHSVCTTIVTVEEQCAGWIAAARSARTAARVAEASQLFAAAVAFWARYKVFPQTEASLARFEQLVRLKLNVGRLDLRIAAIALELDAAVVTRNRRDFGRVPGLPTDDWAT